MRKSTIKLKEESAVKMTPTQLKTFLTKIIVKQEQTIEAGKHHPGNPTVMPMVQMAEGKKDLAEAILDALNGNLVHLRILAGE